MRLVRSPGAVGVVRALELVELVDLVGQANRAGEELRSCDWTQRLKPLSIEESKEENTTT